MKKSTPVLLAAGAALGFSLGYIVKAQKAEKPVAVSSTQEAYTVSRVIDGDTLDIKPGVEILLSRIRLLGIDTPERGQPFYIEASRKLEELVSGNEVLLEKDVNDTDKYGRALRYVIAGNKNINIEMVRLGCARAYMHKGLKYENEFLAAEKEARGNKRGIWGR